MIKDCLVTKQADLLKDWIIKLAFFFPPQTFMKQDLSQQV